MLCFRLQERYEGGVEASGNAHFVRFGYHAHSAQQFCFDDDVECFPFAWCREIVHLLVGGDDGCSRSQELDERGRVDTSKAASPRPSRLLQAIDMSHRELDLVLRQGWSFIGKNGRHSRPMISARIRGQNKITVHCDIDLESLGNLDGRLNLEILLRKLLTDVVDLLRGPTDPQLWEGRSKRVDRPL